MLCYHINVLNPDQPTIVFQIKILSALSVGDIRQYDLLPLAFSKSLSGKLYNEDFYAWLLQSANLLRAKKFEVLDSDNIAEDLEGMARSNKRQLINHMAILVAHLLKWQFQPALRSRSWRQTIKEQRKRMMLLLSDSPSLKFGLTNRLQDAYDIAVLLAANQTGLDEDVFPLSCEYQLEEVLDADFYPD